MEVNKIIEGDCLTKLGDLEGGSVDLVYLDPPFFTQRKHSLSPRDNSIVYEFMDTHESVDEYVHLIGTALEKCKVLLKNTGSIFVHCDRSASHYIRFALDAVFGKENFQSEIIWSYKRWSNSRKGLLNSHQTIFFYSKTSSFKFKTLYTNYAATTNLDQILQERRRDENGKSVYKTGANGDVVISQGKKGVPLSDVWEVPYLNPKAKERCGYPTQKPILLLNRIIEIASDVGDLVLDPFCGSGTTCVASKLLGRDYIGIDISAEAVKLANSRLEEMIVTRSQLMEKGASQYLEKSQKELAILADLDAFPVQRNAGIDGFLRTSIEGVPVPVKIQADHESLFDAIEKLERASSGKHYPTKIVIQTKTHIGARLFDSGTDVRVIKTIELQTMELRSHRSEEERTHSARG